MLTMILQLIPVSIPCIKLHAQGLSHLFGTHRCEFKGGKYNDSRQKGTIVAARDKLGSLTDINNICEEATSVQTT